MLACTCADFNSGALGEFEEDENNTLSFHDQLDKVEQEMKRTELVRNYCSVLCCVSEFVCVGGCRYCV